MNIRRSGSSSQNIPLIGGKRKSIFQKSMLLIECTFVEEGLERRYLPLKSWRLQCLYLKQGLGL